MTPNKVKGTPVVANVEVLVVGGGPAGIGAAISAARGGAEVLLVERYGFLGGNSTTALVNPLFTFHDVQGNLVIRGIAEEIVQRLKEAGGTYGHVRDLTFDNASMTPFDPELMKIVLLEMAQEAGVKLLLHSFCTDIVKKEDLLTHVIFETKSGRIAVAAQAVIDCTGDADLAYKAGIPTLKGRPEDGVMQPASTFFRIDNIDFAALRAWMKENNHLLKDQPTPTEIDGVEAIALLGLTDLVAQAISKGDYPADAAPRILLYQLPIGNQMAVNVSRIQQIDGTDVFDLTKAEIRGREQAWEIYNFLRQYVGGFTNSYIVETGEIGIRETRRIQGKYVLTEEDVLTGKGFHDGVACGTFAIDIHPPEGQRQVFTGSGRAVYEIPLRCFMSDEVENLLVAGRCISTTHIANGSTRVMATCMAMGQGAGTAMALARTTNWRVADLDVEQIRTKLIEQGQYLLDSRCMADIDQTLKLDRTDSSGEAAAHYNPFALEG